MDYINFLIAEYISPTIVTLIAIGVLYGLYKGVTGFWEDSAGQRLAAIYMALMPLAVIYLTVKLSMATDWSIWILLLCLLGMFAVFMWTGKLLFPNSNMFGANDSDEENNR
jgi:ABC-type microcin C transport system permease subunit YejE